MLSEYILKDINNPRSEYVEMLLSQLAGLNAPARTVKKDAPKPDGAALEKQIATDLDVPVETRTPVYLARVMFAKAELARMMRDPDRQKHFYDLIAKNNPEDLGPILLSMLGQYLYDNNALDQAIPFFTRLRDAYPNSSFSDAAPVGLGRIALAKKDYIGALKEFEYAINRSSGFSMLKEATFGKALALRGQGKTDEAKKLFEEIVASKEWRGIEKAGSLFELGEIAAASGDRGVANAYFQRVYLSHGAFPEYAAKSYIRSAEMLALDGQHGAARDTYRKLLLNSKFAQTPEAAIAKERANSGN
jgi:TolA-binding protein